MLLYFLPLISFILSTEVYSSPLRLDEAWQEDSDPQIMSFTLIKNFNSLPLSGKVQTGRKYWSGDYWALQKGSINYRWYARNKIGFNYHSPDLIEARGMSIQELAALSPSEKYDLFTGKYDYPLKHEVEKIADPKAKYWEGMCHGWSGATLNHPEPTPKLLMNPDGIEIPFGSTDIKALISYYYAFSYRPTDTFQMGKRCFEDGRRTQERDCINDLNAGAFHLVLANKIGLSSEAFIADIQRFEEVWNHPVTSYESRVLGSLRPDRSSAVGTVELKKIRTTITYVDENGNDWRPVIGTNKQAYKSLTYDYVVELDRNGNIIGGEWLSLNRPDFLWQIKPPLRFEGTLNRLSELLNE